MTIKESFLIQARRTFPSNEIEIEGRDFIINGKHRVNIPYPEGCDLDRNINSILESHLLKGFDIWVLNTHLLKLVKVI